MAVVVEVDIELKVKVGPKTTKKSKKILSDICSKNGIMFFELDDRYDVIVRRS